MIVMGLNLTLKLSTITHKLDRKTMVKIIGSRKTAVKGDVFNRKCFGLIRDVVRS